MCFVQVGSCKEYEWFEQLLQQLLKTDDKSSVQLVLTVCQMMVDCLVETLLTLDETSGIIIVPVRMVYCMCSIHNTCTRQQA